MRDLTERLRSGFGGLVPPVCDEAANVIEALRDELSDALAVLDAARKIATDLKPCETENCGHDWCTFGRAIRKYKEV